MLKHFKPKPGRFGVETNVVSAVFQGTVAGTDTTPVYLPVPFRKAVIGRIAMACSTSCLSNGGTVLATVQKYSKASTADVAITAATSIEGMTGKQSVQIPVLTTLTDAQLTVLEGDSIRVDIVAASSIDTQPINLSFSVELLLQE